MNISRINEINNIKITYHYSLQAAKYTDTNDSVINVTIYIDGVVCCAKKTWQLQASRFDENRCGHVYLPSVCAVRNVKRQQNWLL